ncbi:MAG: DUF488 family protein [Actinomycetales bacterium]
MKLFTIGFTQKPAEEFFTLLQHSAATSLIDVRLNNVSQLSGFAKRDDLAFLLEQLCDMTYRHEPLLAPSQDLLTQYRKKQLTWHDYEVEFLKLITSRQVEHALEPALFDNAVLLCSEHQPNHCHRRLAAEYLADSWPHVQITHL